VLASLGRLRKFLFGISLEETTFTRRGFHQGEVKARQQLERSGQAFVRGYHMALEDDAFDLLVPRLNAVEAEFQGFAFEGAAMGLALLDYFLPWRHRLSAFLDGPATAHIYMVHVGAGWTLARLPQRHKRLLARLDPLLCWLAIDGYGFHEGYFSWRRSIGERNIPNHLSGYARHVFDQGLGRSLWFVDGADVTRIPVTIASFPPSRHGDLWSGVGLACAYAGGVSRADIEALRTAAGAYRPQLAQGAAFAAMARQRAGNLVAHTDIACEVLCGLSSNMAASITDVALQNLPHEDVEPGYEILRQRIQSHFATEEVRD
jgi:enediyne biosynthesis protein E3